MSNVDGSDHAWKHVRTGALPCLVCGIEVRDVWPDRVEVLELERGTIRTGFSLDGVPRVVANTVDMPVTRCDQCWLIHQTADDLRVAHPDVRAAIGDPSLTSYRIELVLNALDALGVDDHRVVDKLMGGKLAILRSIDALALPGGRARWATTARAQRWPEPLAQRPSATRWGHLSPEQTRTLREAQVDYYVERTAKPVPVTSADDEGHPIGCGLCGVGHVLALPSEKHRAWVYVSADPEPIGARPGPDELDIVLCPRCDQAVDKAHGIGQSAMRISMLDYLGANFGPRFDDLAPHLVGVVGWAALPSGTSPNGEPWQHVDLSGIRAEMERQGVPRYGDYQPLTPAQMPADVGRQIASATR